MKAAGLSLFLVFAFVGYAAWAMDENPPKKPNGDCKAGLYNCGCLRTNAKCFETEELAKKGGACWGDLAQFNCPKDKKAEIMDEAFALAKKSEKLVLYISNTGG